MALRFMEGFDRYGDTASNLPYIQVSNVNVNGNLVDDFHTPNLELSPPGGIVLDGFDLTGRVFVGMWHRMSVVDGNPVSAVVEFGDNSLSVDEGTNISPGGVLSLTTSGDGNTETVEVHDAAGNTWDISSSWPARQTWFHFEVGFDVDSSPSNIVVRVNEKEILNVTGDTTAVPAIKRVVIGSGGGHSSVNTDDVVITDDSPGQMTDFPEMLRIATVAPDGAGDSSDFTSSTGDPNWQNVDERAPDDSNFTVANNRSQTVGSRDLFTHFDLVDAMVSSPDEIESIKAVRSKIRAASQGSGKDLAAAVKPPGATTVYLGTAVRPRDLLGTGIGREFETFGTIFEQNPETNATWTKSDINNLQACYETVS